MTVHISVALVLRLFALTNPFQYTPFLHLRSLIFGLPSFCCLCKQTMRKITNLTVQNKTWRLHAHCKLRQSWCARCLVQTNWRIGIYLNLPFVLMNATMTHPVEKNNRHDDEQPQQQSVVGVVVLAAAAEVVLLAVAVVVLLAAAGVPVKWRNIYLSWATELPAVSSVSPDISSKVCFLGAFAKFQKATVSSTTTSSSISCCCCTYDLWILNWLCEFDFRERECDCDCTENLASVTTTLSTN